MKYEIRECGNAKSSVFINEDKVLYVHANVQIAWIKQIDDRMAITIGHRFRLTKIKDTIIQIERGN